MTVESLEYFFAIANGSTYMDVAESFHLSQSALSKSIKRLEQELGVELFNRSGRSVKLTDAGQLLLDDLKILHDPFIKLKKDMSMLSHYRHISCYIRPSSSVLGLRNIIHSFTTEYPWISVSLRDDRQRGNVMSLLSNHETDIVIMHRPPQGITKMQEIFLSNDHVVVVLPEKHPLAKEDLVDMAALQEEEFLLILRTKHLLEKTCQFLDIPCPRSVMTNMNREELLWRVAVEKKAAIFFSSDISSFVLHGVVARKLKGMVDQPYIIVTNPAQKHKTEHLLLRDYILSHIDSFTPKTKENHGF